MAAHIEVPGKFVFRESDAGWIVEYILDGNAGVLSLNELLATPKGYEYLMAVLGVGFQSVQSGFQPSEKPEEADPASTLEEINASFEDARRAQEEALRSFQESAEESIRSIHEAFGATDESTNGAGA